MGVVIMGEDFYGMSSISIISWHFSVPNLDVQASVLYPVIVRGKSGMNGKGVV